MKLMALTSLITALSFTGLFHVAAAEAPPVPTEKTSPATTDNAAPSNLDKARDDKTDEQSATNEADESNSSAAAKTYHKFKIDVAYIDMAYLFNHSDEFNQKREKLKQDIDRAQKEVQKAIDEIRRKQDEYDDASQDEAARLYQEIKDLKQKQEKLRQDKQKEFLETEARIYQKVYDHCRAEVARYAQENDIHAVRRWSPKHEREAREHDGAGNSAKDVTETTNRLNQVIVYQADESIFVTNDITQDILKRMNHKQPEKSDTPTDPAESDAPAAPAADRHTKINVAYIDVGYVFRNFDEFNQKRDELKRKIELTEKKITQSVDEIRRKQDAYSKASPNDAARLYQELKDLAQKTKELQEGSQKEFLKSEAGIYQQIYDRCQAEIARYAKENHIDVVRRWDPKFEREAREIDKQGNPPPDPKETLNRLNRTVIYQADERDAITIDISKEIVKRLNRDQHDQSASTATTPK